MDEVAEKTWQTYVWIVSLKKLTVGEGAVIQS